MRKSQFAVIIVTFLNSVFYSRLHLAALSNFILLSHINTLEIRFKTLSTLLSKGKLMYSCTLTFKIKGWAWVMTEESQTVRTAKMSWLQRCREEELRQNGLLAVERKFSPYLGKINNFSLKACFNCFSIGQKTFLIWWLNVDEMLKPNLILCCMAGRLNSLMKFKRTGTST